MSYYKLTKGSSEEIGVDRAAKNFDGKILQPIITDSGGTAIANSWFANMYKSASGSSNGDITAARYLYSSGNKLNDINIPSASGKTLATTDQIQSGQVLKGTFTTDANGTIITSPSNINWNRIISFNVNGYTVIPDDDNDFAYIIEDGVLQVYKNGSGVFYYI